MSKKTKTFEENLQRLEEISELLESEETGLDETIKLYEEGIELAKACYDALQKAELKVTELQQKLEDSVNDEFDLEE